jgi:hypothetical protein
MHFQLPQEAASAGDAGDNDDNLTRQLASDLKQHSVFGDKYTGGAGETATADWVADRLRVLGFAVNRLRFDWPFFALRKARLMLDSKAADVIPQVVVVPTPPDGVNEKLAVIRADFEAIDARGRIAFIVAPYKRHASLSLSPIGPLVRAVAEAGAKAVVIVTTGPTGEAVALNTPGETPFVRIPTAVIAPKDSEPFLLAAREGMPATLIIDGTPERRATSNIIGTLDRGKRWLVLSTPRTGFFECASERGTGTAAFLALATWAVRRFPETSLFVMNSGAHEYGGAGTERAITAAPPPEVTALWVHVGAALATCDAHEFGDKLSPLPSADSMRLLMVSDALRPIVAETFKGITGLERPSVVLPAAGELPGIVKHGYSRAFAVLGIHRWFHTRADTLDKVDARLLAPVVKAHQRTIERVLAFTTK